MTDHEWLQTRHRESASAVHHHVSDSYRLMQTSEGWTACFWSRHGPLFINTRSRSYCCKLAKSSWKNHFAGYPQKQAQFLAIFS